ncbi:MAG: hypothetical protein M3Z29_15300 [Pseudomonadota bacterium]|nr:hypothetical protein [Pseudomonadota bacterium]
MHHLLARIARPCRRSCALGALVSCLAPLASAAPSGPLPCAEGQLGIGGCPPYAQTIFFGTTGPVSVFEYENSTLDITQTGSFGTVRGAVDLSNALVRTFAQSSDDGNVSTNNGVSASAVGVDVFTLRRLGSPSPDFFTFSVIFEADGVGGIDTPGYGVNSYLFLRPDTLGGAPLSITGSHLDDASGLQAGYQVPVFQQFNVHLMTFANLTARLDQSFQLSYTLRTDVSETSFLDFTHTARIHFVLPDGLTVTSMGGYNSAAAVTAVPEPETWLLIAAGLLVTGRLARNRNRVRNEG